VEGYADFCAALTKMAELRGQVEELHGAYVTSTEFLKAAMRKEATPVETVAKAGKGLLGGTAHHLEHTVGLSAPVAKGLTYGGAALGVLGGAKYVKDMAADKGLLNHVPLDNNPYYQNQRAMRQQGY
jgi:hypothetical protein